MVQRSDETFHSGQLAQATGVSADTIRYYERIGVLPKAVRSASGYRIYPESAVKRVNVVQRFVLHKSQLLFPPVKKEGSSMVNPKERPYSISELAVLHNLSRQTVVRLYENEPDVLILEASRQHQEQVGRRYRTIRVPQHVYRRVKHRMENR